MIDVMIDLETMGTKVDSPILSIGLVSFHLGHAEMYTASRELQVDFQDCIDHGLKPSASTIMWWMSQNEEARFHLLAGQKRANSIQEALYQVADFFADLHEPSGEIRVWSNGADFDIPMLAHLFGLYKHMDVPWEYYNTRCYRTMKTVFRSVQAPLFKGVRHSAVADALHQVNHLQAIWRQCVTNGS